MLLAAGLIYSPWVIRNYLASGKLVFLTTLKGITSNHGLYINKNIFSGKDCDTLFSEATDEASCLAKEEDYRFKERDVFQFFYSSKDEIAFDKLLFEKVKKEYIVSPTLFLKGCLFNFIRFFFYGTKKAIPLNILVGAPLIILFIMGSYIGYEKKLNITPMLIFIFAYIMLHLPTLGWARYHIPLIPFLSIIASLVFLSFSHTNDLTPT